ncbi:dipeptidase [Sphingopyxis bauzanensis]|uniref:Dipeptidase n=1 Tax=Sphingopyxis bauzanensis TaxID=651663 RepID=A0A246JWI2_9SPHN|nr:membrane dipeptidase [Sphingopyxis bauzanensis]OWQ97441.1 dipeptidase [Sphingopyxis bauzanensis]GGJ36467.1 dipeptidase [Sphingopyxis bauzanensis]
MQLSRRQALCAVAGAALAAPHIARAAFQVSPFSGKTYSKRAVELVKSSVIVDMLAPIKIDFDPSFYAKPMSEQMAADFRASGLSAIHHAVGIGGPTAKEQALSFFAIWGNYVARNSDVLTGVDTFADILDAKKDGKVAVIMGLQNADHFLRPADVKSFYELGQRCAQLTYNSQNRIGSGSTDRVDGGVSDFGVSIIEAMNAVGMLVDVSHSGDRTTLDAIEISKKPISITHSNCRALIDHPRVKTDAAIKAMAAKGGVMGITGVRNFVSKTDPTTIVNYADHIEHVIKLVGIDHVGIGTDADLYGYDDTSPEMNKMLRGAYKDSYAFREKIDIDGFDHPLKMFDLTEELIRRGYSDANIRAVLGGNFQRLLTATWGG